MQAPYLSRRDLLRYSGLGLIGAGASGWFPMLAAQAAADPQRRRQCVLLWMSGGPSQTDTFDMKPGHENGGEFREIQTAAPGLRFSEHLPKLAEMADKMAVLRGLNTKEGDHGRGTYLMRTGHKPMGPVQHPSIGASLANQLGDATLALPNYVSIGPYRAFNQDAFGAGFLGPKFGPLIVGASDMYSGGNNGGANNGGQGFPELKVEALERSKEVTEARMEKRLRIWNNLQSQFLASRQSGAAKAHQTVYQSALQLMSSKDATAFQLSQEPDEVREVYGRSVFGQGCLLARRLIERGVAFVEVSLGTSSGGVGWDTHSDNFNAVRQLSGDLDSGWATLMRELDERGLLESTTILWMGEFGRTPRINGNTGRDHFPAAWSAVLAGGGIAGGQAYGKTSDDGLTVADGQITAPDLLATLCEALGVGGTYNTDGNGRPIPISDGTSVRAVLA
jgi:hypothetical protein